MFHQSGFGSLVPPQALLKKPPDRAGTHMQNSLQLPLTVERWVVVQDHGADYGLEF
jgi:hypothetical protein